MTNTDLDNLESLLAKATARPWVAGLYTPRCHPDPRTIWSVSMFIGRMESGWIPHEQQAANAALAVAAVNNLAPLIAEVRRLRVEVEVLQKKLLAKHGG